MKQDNFGRLILSETDLCDLYMKDHTKKIICYIDKNIKYHEDLELENVPEIINYIESFSDINDFDKHVQSIWYMPTEYKNLDIAKWILEQCKTSEEQQRAGKELLMFLDRDLFPLLQYLKYLVDTMRKYNIVWGVGRGSSVSSYVLYLIGIHKINPIYYDLDINEFLK